jgi:hypothetical protein
VRFRALGARVRFGSTEQEARKWEQLRLKSERQRLNLQQKIARDRANQLKQDAKEAADVALMKEAMAQAEAQQALQMVAEASTAANATPPKTSTTAKVVLVAAAGALAFVLLKKSSRRKKRSR